MQRKFEANMELTPELCWCFSGNEQGFSDVQSTDPLTTNCSKEGSCFRQYGVFFLLLVTFCSRKIVCSFQGMTQSWVNKKVGDQESVPFIVSVRSGSVVGASLDSPGFQTPIFVEVQVIGTADADALEALWETSGGSSCRIARETEFGILHLLK